MGRNLVTCCHKCKEKVWHLRRRESDNILPFYKEHTDCIVEDQSNVETLDDQYQEREWMCDETGYTDYGMGG